jgi:serine/threonine-protein kinase
MAAVPPGLATALQDRYRLDRELGQGGMATVYLAHDLKHHRQVALKVLRPELAATLGPERFLREITLTAQLDHPHILPLLDSGEAGAGPGMPGPFLFYVMPYVEGESLRDRLNREKQLPLDDALQITREVADALSYAHSHQIIHRDIKPENILLAAGHARVADFGIARAITAAGGEKLTETGVAVGTPAYMSPEQAAGERELDGRSDVYALACVLYEMLAGQPPFTGPTAESIVRQHIAAPAPNITVIRPAVPAAIGAAVQRAMAKAPADRFGSAAAFMEALTQPATAEALEAKPTRWPLIAGLAAVTVLAATLAIALGRWPLKAPAAEDPLAIKSNVVAVMPFRLVSADTGSTLRSLALGIPELFAMKITGEFGPRISYPPTVRRLWKDAGGTLEGPLDEAGELRIAETVGAGSLIRGSLAATDTSLVFTAELVAVPSGEVRVHPTSVEGHPEEWLALADRLAWQLLAQDAGSPAERLPQLARHNRGRSRPTWPGGRRATGKSPRSSTAPPWSPTRR